jgi:hypothetical protein
MVESGAAAILWLIANGARAFPVECGIADAVRLHQHSAASDAVPSTVTELFRYV